MLDQEFLSLKRVFFSHNLENLPKQAISPNLHIFLTVGTLSQAPLMIVQSQCCFSMCLYQFRGFGLLARGNRNLVLGRTGRGHDDTKKSCAVSLKVVLQGPYFSNDMLHTCLHLHQLRVSSSLTILLCIKDAKLKIYLIVLTLLRTM